MRLSLLLSLAIFILSSQLNAQSNIFWSQEIDIASSIYSNQHPRIVASRDGNPMVIWGKYTSSEVYFSKMDSSGFTTPVALNPMSIPVFTQSWAGPDIASKGDTVYVVYKMTPEDTNHIYIVSSFDGGVNFSSPVQVDHIADSISRFPTVAVDALGNPVVAFMKFDQGFVNARYVVARSVDMGASFLPDVLASKYNGENVCDCCPGSLVISGANAAMLYRNNLNDFRTIWAGVSSDSCNNFQFGMQVDNTSWFINACPSTGPDGIIIGDSLYTVFMSEATGETRCYITPASMSQIYAGTTKSLISDTVTTISNQNYPRISNYENKVGVVCRQTADNDGQIALFFTDSIENGLPGQFDTVATGTIVNTDIVITKNAIHIVWQDDNSETIKYRVGLFDTTTTNPNTFISSLLDRNNYIVYPNPVADNFSITGKNIDKIKSIDLINAQGVKSNIHFSKEINKINCSRNELAPGIYFLAIIDLNNTISYKKLILK